MEFIGKAHGNAAAVERPKLFDQAVVQFASPLALEKRNNFLASIQKFRAVSPPGIRGVSQRDLIRVTRIPTIFREPNLQYRSVTHKRRKWRTCRHNACLVLG